jgi:hypothetical protein
VAFTVHLIRRHQIFLVVGFDYVVGNTEFFGGLGDEVPHTA